MNPYAVAFGVGVGVGLIYERDLNKAIERSAITTSAVAFLQSPAGKRAVAAAGGAAYTVANDAVNTVIFAATTKTGLGVRAAAAATATYTAAVAAGYVIGAATGTAIASTVFGPEGKQKAIDFYTFQNTRAIDYLPHYNAYKIVKHYVTT